MAKRVNNVQETFAILARLEAERNQASQKGKKGKRGKEEKIPNPVSILPQAPFLEKAKHFTSNEDVDTCAYIALAALENLPEHLSNSDILIFDTVMEKLTKPRMLDFESDLVDVYGRVKRGIDVVSKALDKKLKTLSAKEIIQSYGCPYSSVSGRIVDVINNIRVTAIKLKLLSEKYRPSGARIRTSVVLEPNESYISSEKGASSLNDYAGDLLKGSIELADKALKKGYEFQETSSYVGSAKEFQLEADEALTEKMCNLVKVDISSQSVNHKSVEVCSSYMADKCAGKLSIIKLVIDAKLAHIDFSPGATGFIAMKMKGCTIPDEMNLLRLQWSHFCQGKEIPTILYTEEARRQHNQDRKKDSGGSGLLAGTDLLERARRGEFPLAPVRPAKIEEPRKLQEISPPAVNPKIVLPTPSNETSSPERFVEARPILQKPLSIEAPVKLVAPVLKKEIVVLTTPKKVVSSEDLELGVSIEIITRVNSIDESDRFKIRDEVVRILSDVRSRNPNNVEVIDKIASECDLDIINPISSKDRIKQQIKSFLDKGDIQSAFDLSISKLESGFNYELSPKEPITTERLVVALQKSSPKYAVILASRALEAGMNLKFDTIYRTKRAFEESVSSCENWGAYTDFIIASVDKGLYDFNAQKDEISLGITLAELGSHQVQNKYNEKDFYDIYIRQKEVIRLADFLLDEGLVFKYEDARFNNLIRGIITSAIRLRRIGRRLEPDPDSALKSGLDRFKTNEIDLKSESSRFLSEGSRLILRVLETGNKINPATVNFMLTKIKEERLLPSENDILNIEHLIKQMLENNSSDIRVETLSAFVKHLVDLEDFPKGYIARYSDNGSHVREPAVFALSIAVDGIESGKSFGLKTLEDIYRLTKDIDKENAPKWMLDIVSSKREYLGKVLSGGIKQVSAKAGKKKSSGNSGSTVYESPSSHRGLFDGTGILERFSTDKE